MRAVRLTSGGGYDGLTLGEESVPELGRHDVLLTVKAASLNFRDTIIARGQYQGPLKAAGIPLSDGAGEVVAVGSDVTPVVVGDRVAANCDVYWLAGPASAEYHCDKHRQ